MLSHEIQKSDSISLVGSSESWGAALDEHLKTPLSCVIMEMALGEGGGLAGVKRLMKETNRPKLIAQVSVLKSEGLRIALAEGIDGYIFKGDSLEFLIGGIDTVLAGGAYLSPSPGALLKDLFTRRRMKKFPHADEHDILREICAGSSLTEIIERRNSAAKEVKRTAQLLYRRFQVKRQFELKMIAVALGLVDAALANVK